MPRRVPLLAAALLAVVVPDLSAQDQSNACSAVSNSKVGYWAAFDVEGAAAAQLSALRFALVERNDEANSTWYEFSAETNQGAVVVQLDVPGWPFETTDIKGAIVKMAGQPAMRLPNEMLSMLQQQMGDNPIADFAEQCETAAVIGNETIETAAGSFKSIHMRSDENGSEAWISADVPFGIVKGLLPDGGTMTIKAYGTDATSGITETPQPMPGMGSMNR